MSAPQQSWEPRENQTSWSLLYGHLLTGSQGQKLCDLVTLVLYSLQESRVQTAPAANNCYGDRWPQAALPAPDLRSPDSCMSGLTTLLIWSIGVPFPPHWHSTFNWIYFQHLVSHLISGPLCLFGQDPKENHLTSSPF